MSGTTGGDQQIFNSKFTNWLSAGVVNPKNGFRFCNQWFVTHVNRGRPMDIALEPLELQSESGVRLLLRTPPEQVRMWHPLAEGVAEDGKKVVKVRMRGLPEGGAALQLDSMALFNGNEAERKVDRRLIGAVPLNANWHEFTVPLRPSNAALQGQRYLSLRFSGKGIVEVDFCRIEDVVLATTALASAKSLAAKVLAGFRRTTPTAPGDDGALDEEQVIVDPPLVIAGESREIPSVKLEPDASPAAPTIPAAANVLRNAQFEKWSANRPDQWRISAPGGVTIKRGAASREQPFATGCLSVIFDKPAPNQVVSIAQRVAGLAGQQFVDVVVVGQADARSEVELVLTNAAGKVIPGARATVTLWPRWLYRTARIALPSKLEAGRHGFALIVREGQANVVHLAFVAAGVAGQDIAGEFEIREVPSVDSNAVVNGRLEHWLGRLTRSLTKRRTDITDEWLLASKAPCPGVEARLTEISPRGLRDGRDHPSVLAVALHGEIAGPYLRVEAGLDALQVLAASPRQLRFCARAAELSASTAGRERPFIQQIFVAERRRIAPDRNEFDVKRLFTIRRNIRIGRIGEFHALPLRADQRVLLAAKAQETLREAGHSLLLIFEFAGFVDIAIGDVYLGNGTSAPDNASPAPHEAVMEDTNIASQLTLLKGLEHWQSTRPLLAVPHSPQPAQASPANWTWLPESRFTVDIVICVYNAIEETLGCLESIYRNTTIPHTVTIVDDSSGETTREQLRRYVQGKPWIRLFENEKNLGYTKSANIGLSCSTAEWVVLLNSDTIVTPGWLEGMFEVVKARPKAAMVGPLSNAASWQSVPELHDVKGGWSSNPLPEGFRPDDIARLVGELSPKQFPEATLLNGFCTLMRREVIEEIGYLDEVAFPMGYGEENDLCLRVRKAGYTLAVADHVYVYHVKSASFGSARRSELSKRGTAQLALKHPDVDMKAVQREMAELTSLMELRKKLRRKLRPEPGQAAARPVERPVKAASPGIVSYQLH